LVTSELEEKENWKIIFDNHNQTFFIKILYKSKGEIKQEKTIKNKSKIFLNFGF
jgi:hypothetical protein